MTADAIRTMVLAESDRRDRELQARLDAWQEGRNVALAALSDSYEDGFTDGVLAYKKAQHATHKAAEDLRDWVIAEEAIEHVRWELRGEPRTRETFALPHPDDYTGGPVAPW